MVIVIGQNAGHQVGGVGRVGRAVGVAHVLGVAVVGDDDAGVAGGQGRFDHGAGTGVGGFHGFHHGLEHAGVAHHVGVGEVQHHKVGRLRLQLRHQRVAQVGGAHLGLQVVGGHFGRRAQDAPLARELILPAAREKERDVRVLLGFGNANLGFAVRGQHLAQGVVQVVLLEHRRHAHKRVVVVGEGEVVQVQPLHLKSVVVLLRQHLRDFTAPVGAEVEAQHHVAVLDSGQRLAIGPGLHNGLQKLIRHAVLVLLLHGLNQVLRGRPDAVHQQVVGHLHPFPAAVAVHGVVAAHHRGNLGAGALHVQFQVVDEADAALRVGVAPVGEGVHEHAPHPGFVCYGAEGFHVVDVRVHPAIGEQANEVQGLVVDHGVLQRFRQGGHLAQLALAHGPADAHQFLVDHAAGADVHVAHFGVAHLSFG